MIHPPFSPSSHQKLEVKLKRKLSLLLDNCGSKGISLWVFIEPYLLGFLRISERTWPSFCPPPTLVQVIDFLWIMKFQIPYCYFSTSDRTLASTFIWPDFFHDIFKIKIPWIWPPKFSLSLFAVCWQGRCQFLFVPLPPETQHKEHWTWGQRSVFIHLCDLGQWVSAFHRASTSSPRR